MTDSRSGCLRLKQGLNENAQRPEEVRRANPSIGERFF